MTMLHNPYFWLGDIGLLSIIVFGLALIEVLKGQPIISVIPLWLVMVASVFLLGKQIAYPEQEVLTAPICIFRFAVGILIFGRLWFYRWGQGQHLPEDTVVALNSYIRWGITGAVGLCAIIGFRIGLFEAQQINDEVNEKADESLDLNRKQLTSLKNIEKKLKTPTVSVPSPVTVVSSPKTIFVKLPPKVRVITVHDTVVLTGRAARQYKRTHKDND